MTLDALRRYAAERAKALAAAVGAAVGAYIAEAIIVDHAAVTLHGVEVAAVGAAAAYLKTYRARANRPKAARD